MNNKISQKLVSIITPMHNSEKTIRQCISSIREQTYQNWELLVTDNKSSDGCKDIVKGFMHKDERIKLLEYNEKPSAGMTRNTSILNSSGRFIAFLDSDDFWHKEKLERQIEFMKKNELALSWTSYNILDERNPYNQKTMPAYIAKGEATSYDFNERYKTAAGFYFICRSDEKSRRKWLQMRWNE